MKNWLFKGIVCMAVTLMCGAEEWFGIQVVDSVTGRGVPLVELKTVNHQLFVTDSNGWAAINEPGWGGQKVYFHIRSHGYEFPKDGFGNRGRAILVRPGGRVTIKLKRVNIAERLYRITGEGIYRDSVLLGVPVPLNKPVLNAKVLGQDTVFAEPYRGKIFWLWGDTDRIGYPLGNFRTSCATSLPPGKGGLAPDKGIDLTYFTDDKGFCRKMCPMPDEKEGLFWMAGLASVPDKDGRERLIGRYTRIQGFCKVVGHGIATFNDKTQVFDRSLKISMDEKWRHPEGNPIRWKDGDGEWLLFTTDARACVRTRPTYEAVHDPKTYQAFTCLADGAKFDKKNTRVQRDANGKLNWRWTSKAPPLTQNQERELVKHGLIRADEAHFQFADAKSGKRVEICKATVRWNDFAKAYVLIGQQKFGTSPFGEIWFGTALSPVGPWKKLVKVVTHDNYTFYNVVHHAFFDQKGGRLIYFEGTYTDAFANKPAKTPRYNYNQIMYRLDLADERLRLVLSH